jgi:predicted nuclease with TOPRIM domain
MNDICNDCKPAIQLEALSRDMESLKNEITDVQERLREVEKFSSSGGEQIKMIFKMLNEIKGSIDKISDNLVDMNKNVVNNAKVKELEKAIEEIKYKPIKDYSKIKIAIITAICSTTAGTVIGIIINKIIK